MKNEILSYMKERSRYWWTSLIVGVLSIILGVWTFTTPITTLVALTIVFIVSFFISGIIDIIYSIANRKILSGWGWILAGGIIDFLFALLLIAMPLPIVTTIFTYFMGFWILFRSIWTIGMAVDINKYINATELLILGILSLLFAIVYLFSPVFRGVSIVFFISLAFIFYGVFRIYFSLRLRKLNKRINTK